MHYIFHRLLMRCSHICFLKFTAVLYLLLTLFWFEWIKTSYNGRIEYIHSGRPANFNDVSDVNEILERRFARRPYRDKRLRPTPYIILPRRERIQSNKILILVPSTLSNFEERDTWRRLYGSARNKEKYGYSAIFSTGTSTEPELRYRLMAEAEKHGDILQADFDDSYRALTIKMMSAIRYIAIAAREVKAIFKVDDDISWRIRNVTQYINSEVNPRSATFHCYRHAPGGDPPRKPSRKWSLSRKEYPFELLPKYCLGWSYIATVPAFDMILQRAHVVRYLWEYADDWLEDVFITGVLNDGRATLIGMNPARFFRNNTDDVFFSMAWFFHLRYKNVPFETGYAILNS